MQKGRDAHRVPRPFTCEILKRYATFVFGANFSLDAPKNTSYQHKKQ